MNRRTLLTTLLSGLSAGVAAIAGRKKTRINNPPFAMPKENFMMFDHDSGMSIGQIVEVSYTPHGIGYTFVPNKNFDKSWLNA